MQRKRITKERINALCKDLNTKKYTSLYDAACVNKICTQSCLLMSQAGILWKKDGYWRGMERIHDDRFFKYKKLQSAFYKKKNQSSQPSQPTLFTKTKVKVDPKKVIKIEPKMVSTRKRPTLGIIQRFKVLFTGKI